MERNTSQRRAILAVIDQTTHPLTPVQILELASKKVRGIGIATVYRFLKQLLVRRYVQIIEIPGRAPLYERKGAVPHDHFLCESCGTVFELDKAPENIELVVPPRFKVARHELFLYGECERCAETH